MAIAYDSASQVGSSPAWTSVEGTAVDRLTIPTFPTSGADRCLFVVAGNSSGGTVRTVSSAIRGGSETCTQKWSKTQGAVNCYGGSYVAPGMSTATVVVIWSGTSDELAAGAVGLTGVHQTTPTGTAVTAGGIGTSSSVTVSAADDEWVIDGAYVLNTAITVGADQTSRFERDNVGGFASIGSSTQLGSVAGDVMTWSFSSETWAAGAVPVKPSPELPLYGTEYDHNGVWPFSSIWRAGRI